MIFDSLDVLTSITERYDRLKEHHAKTHRIQNKKQHFKAPLMVSAHQLKHLNKMDELPCDALMINLEDGVALEHKEKALHLAMLFISHMQKSDKKVIVRVNALDEGGKDEIVALNSVYPDAIRVPKITTASEVEMVHDLIDDSIDVHLSIETAQAWQNLAHLKTSSRVTHFYLGVLDLLADMHLPQSIITHENPTLLYILSHFLVTSKAIGVHPVSFVFQEHENMEAFQSWIELEKKMGFQSKGVISPKQAKAMMALAVSEEEIQRAEHIVKAFEASALKGVTGFVDEEYGFIDEPIYKGALVVLNKG